MLLTAVRVALNHHVSIKSGGQRSSESTDVAMTSPLPALMQRVVKHLFLYPSVIFHSEAQVWLSLSVIPDILPAQHCLVPPGDSDHSQVRWDIWTSQGSPHSWAKSLQRETSLGERALWTFKHGCFRLRQSHFILPLMRSEVRRGSFLFHILTVQQLVSGRCWGQTCSESCRSFFIWNVRFWAWAFITSRPLCLSWGGRASVLQPLQWCFAWVCIELFCILKPLRGNHWCMIQTNKPTVCYSSLLLVSCSEKPTLTFMGERNSQRGKTLTLVSFIVASVETALKE